MERNTSLVTDQSDAYKGWSINFCKKNFWRVKDSIGDFEDAVAECALIWVVCKERYSEANPKQMMALYKKAVYTRFCDLSRKDTADRHTCVPVDSIDISVEYESEFICNVNLASVSDELKLVLGILASAPDEILGSLRESTGNKSVSIFKKIGRMCGLTDYRVDLICKELRGVLRPT